MRSAFGMEELLDDVTWRGFDHSYINGLTVRVLCSQCEVVGINGVSCHEIGCPNQPRACRECGDLVPHGEVCSCLYPLED